MVAAARAVELKSFCCTPCATSYLPAGLVAAMLPAGEMWSVVTESPSNASTRAPDVGRVPVVSVMPSKYGGFFTYVESSIPGVGLAGRRP